LHAELEALAKFSRERVSRSALVPRSSHSRSQLTRLAV
jgi:hypothetical protein